MKTLKRNHCKIWYALRTGTEAQTDSFNNYSGAVPTYADPVMYDRLSTKMRKGVVKLEDFGLSGDYVDSFVTDDMECPIKEDTRLWINTDAYDAGHKPLPYTHVVEAVIPSMNVVRILAREVSVR